MIPSYCPYCNRQVGPNGQPFGDLVPKELQKGTHRICDACYPNVIGNIKPWDFKSYAAKRDKNNGKRV